VTTAQQTIAAKIVGEIENHIVSRGGQPSDWCVGISNDAQRRLFVEHGVDKVRDKLIHRRAPDNETARTVESYFVEFYGTAGGTGGGDKTSTFVYAYRKSGRTDP
jgi:hypothetical protein